MVLAKTQIRSRSSPDNAQREKKIAQLNDFIARFGAGTRASQVQSRRKEVERLQTTELARSNIQRPYIKFTMNRPSGKVALEFKGVRRRSATLQVVELRARSSTAARRSCSSAATASARRRC
jgi:ATPase subunit of ABC transporter with duplicated ATPase domains